MSKKVKNPSLKQVERASQAVILANYDYVDAELQPIIGECPPVLLSLVNERVLDYTVELLVGAGIKDVIIVCSDQHDDLTAYLRHSQWTRPGSPVRLDVFVAHCRSFGDALRELYREMRLIGDFVVVGGDVVADIDLGEVLDMHSIRRTQDRNALLTLVTLPAGAGAAACSDASFVAIDRSNGRVLRYGPTAADARPDASGAPTPGFRYNHEVYNREAEEIRLAVERTKTKTAYRDCHIDIFTQQALGVLVDNFDWDRAELLTNALAPLTDPEEIPLGTVYAHVLGPDDFAVRLRDPRAYAVASEFVVRRLYLHDKTPRGGLSGVTVDQRSVVADGAIVGAGTSLKASVIGPGCVVGNGCTIENSYVWHGANIEDGATIRDSIVCSGVRVARNALVDSGCLLSFNVVVGANSRVPEGSRLTTRQPVADMDETCPDAIDLGDGGRGFLWRSLSASSLLSTAEQPMEIDSNDDCSGPVSFAEEARLMMRDSIRSGHAANAGAVHTELVSLKLAYNRKTSECVQAVVDALLEEIEADESASVIDSAPRLFELWLGLFKLFDPRQPTKRRKHQVRLIGHAQSFCLADGKERLRRHFQHLLHALYKADVVDEDAIVLWAKESPLRSQCQQLLDWLENGDEESDSSDSSDADSDSDALGQPLD